MVSGGAVLTRRLYSRLVELAAMKGRAKNLFTESFTEFIDTSGGIYHPLLAGIKGMARGADLYI